jgi:hypothetical protein
LYFFDPLRVLGSIFAAQGKDGGAAGEDGGGQLKIPWYLEMDRPYPTSLTFTPTPLEVAKSSIVAPIIFSVFVTINTALLHTLKIK